MTWPGVGGVVQTRARTGTHEPDGDDRTHAAATAHSQTEKALQEALEQIASLQRTRQRDEEELLEARRALDEVGLEGGRACCSKSSRVFGRGCRMGVVYKTLVCVWLTE